jgi:hypothetical protein
MMHIHELNDLTNTKIVDLLKFSFSKIEDDSIIKNYHPDYNNQPGNLFYILQHGRYHQGHGKYYVVTVDGKYVASAGWNEYELDTDVALMLTRMYVTPEYRCQYLLGKHVLPLAVNEAKNYQYIWSTVNEYNRALYIYFERVAAGKCPALSTDWPEIYKRFKPIGKKSIYYTTQWVIEYDRT